MNRRIVDRIKVSVRHTVDHCKIIYIASEWKDNEPCLFSRMAVHKERETNTREKLN